MTEHMVTEDLIPMVQAGEVVQLLDEDPGGQPALLGGMPVFADGLPFMRPTLPSWDTLA